MTRDERGTALITGASRGIGRALATRFAAEGFDLALVARSTDRLRDLGEELEATHGVETTVITADLAERGSASEVYQTARERDLTVTALVNNAGFGVYGDFTGTDLDEELDVIELHVATVTTLAKRFGRDMVERGHGYILNVSSIAGFAPLPGSAVYSGVKHYSRAFSEALAEEVDAEGVTVTALCPGATDTGFFDRGGFEEMPGGTGGQMSPVTVADAGFEGLMAGKRVVVPGWLNKVKVFFGRLLTRKQYVKAAKLSQQE